MTTPTPMRPMRPSYRLPCPCVGGLTLPPWRPLGALAQLATWLRAPNPQFDDGFRPLGEIAINAFEKAVTSYGASKPLTTHLAEMAISDRDMIVTREKDAVT